MAVQFFSGGKKLQGTLGVLAALTLLLSGCKTETVEQYSPTSKEEQPTLPVTGLPDSGLPLDGGFIPDPGPIVVGDDWPVLQLLIRTDPADPHNERFLDDWRVEAFNIDDQARSAGPSVFGESAPDGTVLLGLPPYVNDDLPIVVRAVNDAFPLDCETEHNESTVLEYTDDTDCECRQLEIFIPSCCADKAVWLLGPLENALWDYYKRAAVRRGEAWNPSQVDCATWLQNLQLLILTDEIADELNELSDRDDMLFREEALFQAFQENQYLLTPTRPPICMAERRHNGGGMERGDEIKGEGDIIIDDDEGPFGPTEVLPDNDDIVINRQSGLVEDICNIDAFSSTTTNELRVNGALFQPTRTYTLDDPDFMGTISDQVGIEPNLDVSVYNTRLGNGRELDHDKYDDACALTSIIQFTNTDDDEKDINTDSGVTFFNLFDTGIAEVYLTSDGDAVVDDNDYWAIFFNSSDPDDQERVIAVELIGHRQEDFRDVLHMTFDDNENLFIGLRADYELNEEEVDGERGFLAYTLHVWDGRTPESRQQVRTNVANCYEASDVWARQFFVTRDFDIRNDDCNCLGEECDVECVLTSLRAAEFAVRSQCFSNSRANQRWRTDDSGFWSLNTDHGVHGNVIVNPGWLAPDLDYEIYIQKFDEAVFKGPRTIRRTDDVGQLMAELPTLVEGDRVLLKAEDNCCDDYDLVIPCVPEFTGFAGAPGIPYVPVTLPPPVPVPVPGFGPGPGPIDGLPVGGGPLPIADAPAPGDKPSSDEHKPSEPAKP